jgi:class 3 adenylate cyclase
MTGLALALRAEVERINREYSTSIRVRMGISTGPVVAGVIGRKKISYDLWGDSVNLAFGLEAAGEPGTIAVSGATFERVKNSHRFQRREAVPVKGHGAITVYQLLGRI